MLVEKKSSNRYEKRYHFLIDNILDVVGELDLNGIFTYVNPYIYDELGYQPDEIIGREIYEFVHPDDAKKLTKVLLRRQKSHDVLPAIRLKNNKNQFIWYEIKARRKNNYNNQRKILFTLKNISKVKVLEEKLKKKEENYQKITNSIPEIQFWKALIPSKYEHAIRTTSEMLKVIIENIPQCVFWKDTNFKYLGCNGNYSEFIGIEHPESIIGKTDEDLFSNREKIQQIRESEINVISSGKPLYHTNESWIIEKGKNIWLDNTRVPLIDPKGDIYGILVTFEEITDRKIAEEKLRNSEKKYKNLSIELETIMDIIPSMIFVKNKGGIYTRANQVFADYLKLEKEDIIGKSTFDLFPQELATNLKRDDLEIIKNGKPKLNIEETIEFPRGKVSGIISKMPYYTEKDEINGVIGFAIDISERKELEQRLIKSEERYRNLFNNSPNMIALLDLSGKLLDGNESILKFTGETKNNIIGKRFQDFEKNFAGNLPILINKFKEMLKNESLESFEIQLYDKNKRIIWVNLQASLIRIQDETFIQVIMEDITDRNKAKQKLKESEEKYKSLFEQTPVAVLLINFEGKIEDCNKSTEDLFGYAKEELLGIEYLKFEKIPLDTKPILAKSFAKFLKTGVPEHSEIQVYRKDGKMIWINVYPINVKIAEISYLLVVIQDITERKKAKQKLKESEEKYRRLINNLTDIILELDIKGTATYVSPQCYNIMGYQPAEIIGKKVMTFIHPDDVMLIAEAMKQAIKTNEVVTVPSYRLLHKNGDYIYATANGRYIKLDGNEKFIGAIRDDRKSKKLEKEILLERDNLINILGSMEDGVYISDSNYNIEYVNPILTKEFGQYEGKKCYNYFDDLEEVCPWCRNQEVFKGESVRREWYSAKNQKTYELIDTLLENVDGSVSKLEIFRDITERKKAEKELRVLNRITTAFLTISDEEIYGEILQIILDALDSKYGVFGYINDKGDYICPSMTRDLWEKCQMQDKTMTFPRSSWGGMWGKAMLARKTMYANKTFILPEKHIKIQNVLDVPIIHQGELIGNVMIGNKEDGYHENDVELLESIVNKITPILYNKLRIEKEEQKLKKSEEKYKYRYEFESLVSQLSLDFINSPYDKLDELINGALKQIAKFVKAVRSSLFICSDDLTRITNTNEWCADPKDSQISKLQDIPFETFGYYMKLLKEKRDIIISSLDDIPASAKGEREWIKKHGFRSLLFVPIINNNKLYGALGFYSEINIELEWSEDFINLLKIFATVFANTILRKQSEEKLIESEEKYKSLFEQFPMAILLITFEGVIEDCNTSTIGLFGYTKEELLGNEYLKFDIFPPDTKSILAQSFSRFLKTGVPEHSELQMYRKDGKKIWINSYPIVIKIAGSSYILAILQDITQRKTSEEHIRYQAKIIENMSEGLYLIKLDDGTIVYNNPVFEEMFGYDPGEMIGKNVAIVNAPTDKTPEETRNEIIETLKDTGEWHGEVLNVKKDGTLFWCYANVSLLDHPDHGKVIISIHTDITERKREEEEARLHSEIMTNMSEGVYLVRWEDFIIVYANPRFEEMFGYDPGEMIGKNVVMVNAPTDKTPEVTKNEIVGLLKETGEWHGEVLNIKKDGTSFWCYANVSLFDHPEYGRVMVAVHTDITERKKKEEKLRYQAKIIENMSEGLYLIKLDDGTIAFTNPAFEEMFGYNPGEMIGKNVSIVNAPTEKTPEETKNEIMGILKDMGEWHGEVLNVKKDGTRFWCYANVSLFDHPDHGKVIIAVHTDITERKKAENEIKNLAKFPAENPNAVLRLTREKVIYTNKEGEKIFDVKKGSKVPAVLQKSVIKALDTNKVIMFEVDLNNSTYSIDITPISEEDYVNVYGRDITDKKQAESAIRESEKKLKDLIEAIPIGITISNPAGELFEVNSHAINVFGYDSKEDYLNTPAINFYANPEDRLQYTQLLKIGPVRDFEAKFKRKNGKLFWGSLTSIAKTVGDDLLYFNTVQDITERKAAEKTILDLAKFPAENPNPVLRVSKEFILYANQAGNKLFQVTVGDKIPLKLESYVRTAFNENKNLNPEIQLNSHIFSMFITPIEGTEYANVYGLDITERTIAEQKLRESEKKYRSLFDNLLEGFAYCKIITDENNIPVDFLYLEINDAFEKLTGLKKEETVGKRVTEVIPGIKGSEPNLFEIYGKVALTGENTKFELFFEPLKIWLSISVYSPKKKYFVAIFDNITESKKAEQKLKESEEKWRAITQSTPDHIAVLDKDAKFLFINYTSPDLTIDEVFGKSVFDFVQKEYQELQRNVYNEVLSTGKIIYFETGYVDKDGNQNYYDVSSGPLWEAGKVNGIITRSTDITERKETERKLIESEENYRLITENANDIIAVLDEKFRLEYISQAPLNKMLGYKSVDYIGISDLLVIHPDDRKKVLNGLRKGSKTGKGVSDARLKHIDGHYIWVESRGKTFINTSGEKKILINMRDITERKEAEQLFRESEEKYRILLETAVMGLVEFDVKEYKVSYINPKLLEILGYNKEDLLVEKTFLKIVHPEDLKNLIRSSEDNYVEFRIFTKDSKMKWLSGTINNQYDQENNIVRARLWLQDITESKEIEEIKSSLLTRFSHEFKTPLISIKGFADFLLTEYKVNLDEKILSFLRRIKEGSNRLEALINSFVDSSQLEKAVIRVNLKQEDISDLIHEQLHELEGFIGMRDHTIDVALDEQLITAVDKEKIYTVISNILINAIDYTPQGGKISIKSSIDRNFLTISVKDNGIGFTEEEKNQLFKPFGKIERYGKGWDITVGGMGMGLYISKEIIELHGGKIWAESEGRNKGSEFHFSLPIK